MEYKTPKRGDKFSLKIIGGKTVSGTVTSSINKMGFELNGTVYLDSWIGKTWNPVKIVLENK